MYACITKKFYVFFIGEKMPRKTALSRGVAEDLHKQNKLW